MEARPQLCPHHPIKPQLQHTPRKAGRQQGAPITSQPAQEGGKHHSRCPIGLSEALVGLGVGKAVDATRWAPLWCDIRGAVVIVVLAAQAPSGHGLCGGSCIRSAQLNTPLLGLPGVSHCAERPAPTTRARSAPGLLYSNMLPPKQSWSWHVPRSNVHSMFPTALSAGS